MNKIFVGVAGVLVAAICVLGWLYQGEVDRNGKLVVMNSQLAADLQEQSAQMLEQQKRFNQVQGLLVKAQGAKQQIRQQANRYRSRLEEALKNESCADAPLPSVVIDRLRSGRGGKARSGS